ncbi:ribonuclease H [uncultured Microbacterium sp.]|uniref:ribonuclease H family protein n=1 Tax=uncultured Microbacterium sp. TaxID=191216 RepID=UPI0025E4CF89|nr:ribonuclease H [uncultured Microbacterium sp.]
MTITAAADGSALGNPGPNGWAWYIDEQNWAAGGSPHGTNNQGELQAVLELLRATASTADEKLVIECDSRYVIDSVTKWMPGWKRKGWRKSDGGPVLNRELLEGIDQSLVGRDVSFTWVKGHAGHPLNEAADVRANAAATAYQRRQDPDRGPGYTRASQATGSAPAIPPAATNRAGAERPSAAGASRTATAPALWAEASDLLDGLDLPAAAAPITLTVALTGDEHARLRDRADAQGVALEEALRRLI